MAQVIEAFKHVECDGSILHVLPDQVTDIFAGGGVHIFVTRAFVYILA